MSRLGPHTDAATVAVPVGHRDAAAAANAAVYARTATIYAEGERQRRAGGTEWEVAAGAAAAAERVAAAAAVALRRSVCYGLTIRKDPADAR
jgi:hypothetical protein